MTQKRCEFCKKTYTRQQEWKTEEEKKYCLSCFSLITLANAMQEVINLRLKEKKINKEAKITFNN